MLGFSFKVEITKLRSNVVCYNFTLLVYALLTCCKNINVTVDWHIKLANVTVYISFSVVSVVAERNLHSYPLASCT